MLAIFHMLGIWPIILLGRPLISISYTLYYNVVKYVVYEEIVYIALLTLAASIIGTLAGFGISTIMVPILLSIFSLPQTLLLTGIIHWFNDIWKMLLFREGIR